MNCGQFNYLISLDEDCYRVFRSPSLLSFLCLLLSLGKTSPLFSPHPKTHLPLGALHTRTCSHTQVALLSPVLTLFIHRTKAGARHKLRKTLARTSVHKDTMWKFWKRRGIAKGSVQGSLTDLREHFELETVRLVVCGNQA